MKTLILLAMLAMLAQAGDLKEDVTKWYESATTTVVQGSEKLAADYECWKNDGRRAEYKDVFGLFEIKVYHKCSSEAK